MNTSRRLCKVCSLQEAKYSCPQCNLPYCSLQCYKEHGTRCTESFYRTQAVEELRDTKASPADRQHMLEVLKRLQDDSETSSTDSDCEDAEATASLSDATLTRLRKQEQDTGSIDVSALGLNANELAAFEAAVAQGELDSLVAAWQPWWMTEDAAELELSDRGQRMVQGIEEPSLSRLPALAQEPLPPLMSLTKADPSPLLQWQLVDLLYTYCLTARLFNGDHLQECQESASTALAVSNALAGGQPPQTAGQVILNCTHAVLQPSVCGPGARSFSDALWHDVISMLNLGRSVCLCAVADLHQLLRQAHSGLARNKVKTLASVPASTDETGSKQQAGHCQGHRQGKQQPESGSVSRHGTRQVVQAAMRKAWFLLVWVNEQPAAVFEAASQPLTQQLAEKSSLQDTGKQANRARQALVQPLEHQTSIPALKS